MGISESTKNNYFKYIEKFQKYRSKKLSFIGEKLVKIGVTANFLTFLSLVSGLLAVYFMGSNYLYLVIFALLHLLFDGLDGVVARIRGHTVFGAYFDLAVDNLIAILVFLRVSAYLNDYIPFIIAILFFFALLNFFITKLKAPIIFMRTAALGVFIIATFPNFPWTRELLIFGYMVGGATTLFSLAKQLQWVLERRNTR